jgi:hypothetical protein
MLFRQKLKRYSFQISKTNFFYGEFNFENFQKALRKTKLKPLQNVKTWVIFTRKSSEGFFYVFSVMNPDPQSPATILLVQKMEILSRS